MLDIHFIRDNLEAVKANCRNRGVKADPERAVQLDDQRKRLVQDEQVKQQQQNLISKQMPLFAGHPETRQQLIDEGKILRTQIAELEEQRKQVERDLHAALLTIPNMTHPDAPVGTDPNGNKVIKTWGEPRKFDKPKDHVTLCDELDLVDFDAGASVSGQKFYFLKNEAVLLELALVQYAMQTLIGRGYTPVITPDLARVEVLEGIGFMPRDPNPETRQVYTIADSDLCLVATAEITLGGMHRDDTFDELDLPKRYVGLSHCFRTEAGAPGRETRGLYRVHQFTKVEMFVFCTAEQSEEEHTNLP